MTRTKTLALAFYLGAALAGAAIGVAVDRILVSPPQRWWDQAEMRKRMFDQLKLNAAQRDSATRIYDERNRKQDSLLTPVRPMLDSASVEARQRISRLLTPEQQAIYDQMQRKRDTTRSHTEKK